MLLPSSSPNAAPSVQARAHCARVAHSTNGRERASSANGKSTCEQTSRPVCHSLNVVIFRTDAASLPHEANLDGKGSGTVVVRISGHFDRNPRSRVGQELDYRFGRLN